MNDQWHKQVEKEIYDDNIKFKKDITKSLDCMLDFGNYMNRRNISISSRRKKDKWEIGYNKEISTITNKIFKIIDLQENVLTYITSECNQKKLMKNSY
tara:strand:+ start:757 stop:1050 length:294 start_codon:yes stop_codon:yes gene_type:complete